ncbi:MAG: hypothetical protein ACQEP8_00870 [Chlamydiota bacterium]
MDKVASQFNISCNIFNPIGELKKKPHKKNSRIQVQGRNVEKLSLTENGKIKSTDLRRISKYLNEQIKAGAYESKSLEELASLKTNITLINNKIEESGKKDFIRKIRRIVSFKFRKPELIDRSAINKLESILSIKRSEAVNKIISSDEAVDRSVVETIILLGEYHAAAVADNIDKFGVAVDRSLVESIIVQGQVAAAAVADNIDKFNLDPDQNLDLLKRCVERLFVGHGANTKLPFSKAQARLSDEQAYDLAKFICREGKLEILLHPHVYQEFGLTTEHLLELDVMDRYYYTGVRKPKSTLPGRMIDIIEDREVSQVAHDIIQAVNSQAPDDPFTKEQFDEWLIYLKTGIDVCKISDDALKSLQENNIFESIAKYHDPVMRKVITMRLLKDVCGAEETLQSCLDLTRKLKSSKSHLRSSAILLASLGPHIGDGEVCKKFFTDVVISNDFDFKDRSKLYQLNKVLELLLHNDDLTSEDKKHLISALGGMGQYGKDLSKLYKQLKKERSHLKTVANRLKQAQNNGAETKKLKEAVKQAKMQYEKTQQQFQNVEKKKKATKQQLQDNLAAIMALISSGQAVSLKQESLLQDGDVIKVAFIKTFKKIFKLDDAGFSAEQLEGLLQQFSRDPSALLTYYGKLKLLHAEDREKCLEVFETFVKSLLKGDFKEVRYDKSLNHHLQQVLGRRKDLEEKWREGAEDILRTKEGWKVVDTDDPQDLLLCCSEVIGSCMNVNGNPSLNKGLLSYLMDGQNRVLAVKNKEGKIVVRQIIRLLWDGSQPALYTEKLYTSGNISFEIMAQLMLMVQRRAQTMGLHLYEQNHMKTPSTGTVLQFLGGRAPYVYSDAFICRIQGVGLKPQGKLKIKNLRLIHPRSNWCFYESL